MKLKHTIQFLDLKYTNNLVRNIRIFRTKNNFDIGVSTGFVLAPTCSTTKRLYFRFFVIESTLPLQRQGAFSSFVARLLRHKIQFQ